MADSKGTEKNFDLEGINEWCITEAECVNESLDNLFEESTNDSIVSNLIDDADSVDQGNSLALFNQQSSEEYDKALVVLKRKLNVTPEKPSVADLSPRLLAVHITPERQSKRRLFNDSGIAEDEAESSYVQVAASLPENVAGNHNGALAEELSILRSSNLRATLCCKFKEKFGVSFTELTRSFKSSKTCSNNWVVAVFAVSEELIESSKSLLKVHVDYLQVIASDFTVLYLFEFKSGKNRDTVTKLLNSMLNCKEEQILAEPPKLRSTATALYFYKKAITNTCFRHGAFPTWLANLTLVNHQAASAESFQLSDMIQWAYDNDMTDEASIAYNYAIYASENSNAAAFLKTNCQVKYVKDCCAMVRMYKKQEMRNMTMSEWIAKCCGDVKEGDDWKDVAKYLKFQGVNIIQFLIALKLFLKCIPKKMCIVIYGPPDTGKSYFCFHLVKFLKGKVVSFMNKASHFWLTPLLESKIGFLDDATYCCWSYLDTHMRNAFDGNSVSVDVKHKNLQQISLPPMFITTNIDVTAEPTLMYLKSRLTCFAFPNALPCNEKGEPLFTFTDKSWACFFRKFWKQLDLAEEDAAGDTGEPERPFCCTTRNSIDSN
nr:MAG: E1 [Gammapapillomavirus sp.]